MGVWIETVLAVLEAAEVIVTPYVGVWIETKWFTLLNLLVMSHTLRGCVDWNKESKRRSLAGFVTPYVGVWIETNITESYTLAS